MVTVKEPEKEIYDTERCQQNRKHLASDCERDRFIQAKELFRLNRERMAILPEKEYETSIDERCQRTSAHWISVGGTEDEIALDKKSQKRI